MNDLIQTKYDALHSETAQQITLLHQKVQRLEEEQTRLITITVTNKATIYVCNQSMT